VIDYAKVSRFG